ncbi:hypothetical protein C1N73_26805 (plasmid) [Priestia aryabhattai]
MLRTIERIYSAKNLMLCIIVFPGLVSVITRDTPTEYIKSTFEVFVMIFLFEFLLSKFISSRQNSNK